MAITACEKIPSLIIDSGKTYYDLHLHIKTYSSVSLGNLEIAKLNLLRSILPFFDYIY